MRFLLFDRVTACEPGRRVEGVKCVSLTEECLRGHFPRAPRYPGSLVLESMLQLTAWSAIVAHAFRYTLVLSVLEDAETPAALVPGTTLRLVGELRGTNPKGSLATAWAEADGERVARIGRVLYAHLPAPDPAALRARWLALGGTP